MARKLRGFGGRSFKKGGQNQLKEIMKLQEEFQQAMQRLEERLAEERVEGSAGGGAVRVIVTCDYKVVDVEYDEDVLEDKEMFKDLLIAAFNQALENVEVRRKELANEMLPNLGIGGMENLI